jgi:hypothetical protein
MSKRAASAMPRSADNLVKQSLLYREFRAEHDEILMPNRMLRLHLRSIIQFVAARKENKKVL